MSEMEITDSPLNRAHYYSRKAELLVTKEKYEAAILCHGEAAELLREALLTTQSEQAKLSLELQRDRHLQQQRLITASSKQPRPHRKPSSQPTTHQPLLGWKTAKDDKTRLEEQSTAISDLWRFVLLLLTENKELMEEHQTLMEENALLKRSRTDALCRRTVTAGFRSPADAP